MTNSENFAPVAQLLLKDRAPTANNMLLRNAILLLCAGFCYAGIGKDGNHRPCQYHDLKCIGDNLAANSKCNKNVKGSVPEMYTVPEFVYDTPYFNATYIDQNLIIRNHHKCFVSEFFVNVKKDLSVLTLNCYLLDFESDRVLLQHYSAQEDGRYSYHIRGTYPLIRLTTYFQHADQCNLCTAYTFADVTALPIFHVNPNDKPTSNFLSKDLTYLNIYERETFFFRASPLAKLFINSMICDFGCN